MIKEIVEKWENNKDKLKQHLRSSGTYSTYHALVEALVEVVLNSDEDENGKYNTDNITCIDDGDWQGTQIFMIPKNTYQPCVTDYIYTSVYYGSCSVCDTLQRIMEECWENDEDIISLSEEQVEDYFTLCLHLIQNMKSLGQ